MDELAALAAEKEQAQREASESGLSESGFAIYWSLRADEALAGAEISAMGFAGEVEALARPVPQLERELRRAAAAAAQPLQAAARSRG